MSTYRDSVKNAIELALQKIILCDTTDYERSTDEDVAIVADAVFNALGIPEVEQDAEGGYFMHHAGERTTEYILVPLTDEIKNAGSWEEAGHYIWKFFEEGRGDGIVKEEQTLQDIVKEPTDDELVTFPCPSFAKEGLVCGFARRQEIEAGNATRCKYEACTIRMPL